MPQDDVVQTFKRPLDPTLLNLNEQEAQFFKSQTGIQDDKELRKHIIQVQEKAYQVSSQLYGTNNPSTTQTGLWLSLYPSLCFHDVSIPSVGVYRRGLKTVLAV